MKRKFGIFQYQLPAILWAIFILVICTIPMKGRSSGLFKDLPVDKLVHGILFFVLALLMIRGLRPKVYTRRTVILVVLTGFFYGFLIELLQHYFFEERTGDVWDLVADIIGCVVGTWWFTKSDN